MKERSNRFEERNNALPHSVEKRSSKLIVSADEILKNIKEPPLRKEAVIFKKENTKETIQIATAIGDILYTPETGDIINNGKMGKVSLRRRPIWQTFYTSPGEIFSLRDLQKLYDPKGYAIGVNPSYMSTLMGRLKQDIGDRFGKIIQQERSIGYFFAKPAVEEDYEEWLTYQTTVGEVKYDPKRARVIIGGRSHKLTPTMVPLWETLVSTPGEIIDAAKLFSSRNTSRVTNNMMIQRLKERIDPDIIHGTHDRGFGLNVGSEKENEKWKTYTTRTGKLSYNAFTRQVLLNNDYPIKLTPAMMPVWEKLFDSPGHIVTADKLFSNIKASKSNMVLINRMRRILGQKTIVGNYRVGYALSVPKEEKGKDTWKTVITSGEVIKYNDATQQIKRGNGKPTNLVFYEALVWEQLLANPGKRFDKKSLVTIQTNDGPDIVLPVVPGSIIQRLRLKLGDSEREIIKNDQGKGYYLNLS